MWLVEKYGVEEYRDAVIKEVESYERGVTVERFQPFPTGEFERRELLGVHPQPQEGKVRVGILVPAGRLSQTECRRIADLADKYSSGEVRLTVEQNVILPNVDESAVEELLKEEYLNVADSRLRVNPGKIEGNLVSCTGAEFCGLALIETKSHAEHIVKKLEELVEVDDNVRMHWTGCPNSCGQVQAADIGIMGAPARKADETGKLKAVPGCNIFVGGTIGEGGHLSLIPYKKGVPLAEEELLPVLVDILKERFGGRDREASKAGRWSKIKNGAKRIIGKGEE